MSQKDFTIEDAEALYAKYLKRRKMFFTKERKTILKAVFEMGDEHFSVDAFLFSLAQKEYKVSRATVYRSLSQLAEAGVLTEADFGHGHIHYELVGGETHEHIICKECGKVVEVDSEDILEASQKIAQSQGFTFLSHHCQIKGICSDCTK